MTIKDKILEYFKENAGIELSSDQIAEDIGMERKRLRPNLFALRKAGHIEKLEDDLWIMKEELTNEEEKVVEEAKQRIENEDYDNDEEDFEGVPKEPITFEKFKENLDKVSKIQDLEEEKKEKQEIEVIPKEEKEITLISDESLKEKGLNAKVSDIEKKLDLALGAKDTKEKKARLKKLNINKIKRFNRGKNRSIIIMGAGQSLRLIKGEYINGMVRIGENYYDGSACYTWLWENKQPIYVIPEWSIRPLSSKEVYDKAVEEETLIDSQIITIRAAKLVEPDLGDEKGRKKANPMMIIGIVIAAVIAAYVMFGGGG